MAFFAVPLLFVRVVGTGACGPAQWTLPLPTPPALVDRSVKGSVLVVSCVRPVRVIITVAVKLRVSGACKLEPV